MSATKAASPVDDHRAKRIKKSILGCPCCESMRNMANAILSSILRHGEGEMVLDFGMQRHKDPGFTVLLPHDAGGQPLALHPLLVLGGGLKKEGPPAGDDGPGHTRSSRHDLIEQEQPRFPQVGHDDAALRFRLWGDESGYQGCNAKGPVRHEVARSE